MHNTSSGLRIARTFSDGKAFLECYLAHLNKIYELKHFEFADNQIDEYQLEYCKKMHGFVLLIPYSPELSEPHVFLTWSFSNGRLAWDVAASGLGQNFTEIRSIIQQVFDRYLPNVDLITATPIASVRNTFSHGSEVVHHIGLVYACAASNIRRFQDDNPDLRGLFVPLKEVPRLFLADTWNKSIINYANERIPSLIGGGATVEREVHEQRRYQFRYLVHRTVMKPLLNSLDRTLAILFRRTSRRNVIDYVFNYIPNNCNLILDVSAGDHRSSLDLGRKTKAVVLNDVSWDTLSVLVREVANDAKSTSEYVFVTRLSHF